MPDPATLAFMLRAGVVLLAVVGILGAAAELATARHWALPIQFVPWVALAVLVVALLLLAVSRRPGIVRIVRVLGVLVLLASMFGVYTHVAANLAAGALSRPDWAQLAATEQWWLAASRTVGSTPPLAAGVLGYAAALVLLATIGLRRRVPAPVRAEGAVVAGD